MCSKHLPFQIFHHRLMYEILHKLADKLCEKSVECLLLALRSIGFALRKDDPLALRDLILALQKKTSEAAPDLRDKYDFINISKQIHE